MARVKSKCVKVPREIAEKARKLLYSMKILDTGLKPERNSKFVYFPVREHVSVDSIRMLTIKLGQYLEIEERYFWKYKKRTVPITSFVRIGDIIVLNLKNTDKQDLESVVKKLLELKGVRAVYGKVGTEGGYRTANLVFLGGKPGTETSFKEYGIRFLVDISKVYVNVKLGYEHHRIATLARDGENVLDMFSGFGGFTIHVATSIKGIVVANDINPYAIYYLARNILLNKNMVKSRIFLLRSDAGLLPRFLKPGFFDRIIMDYPQKSLEYLGTACKLASDNAILHVYVLWNRDLVVDLRSEIISILEKNNRRVKDIKLREVLEYSPSKIIYCADVLIGH